MNDGATRPGFTLGIRSRQTFRGNGEPKLDLSVLCPQRATDIELGECLRCEDCVGLPLGATRSDSFVLCNASTDSLGDTGDCDPRDAPAADAVMVSSIMTTRVLCVSPDFPVDVLEALLLARNISGAPVVDHLGRAIGVVSKTDLVRHHFQEKIAGDVRPGRVVNDIMMPMAFCLPANESIARAAALMACEGMHRLPVVNARRQVVGLVSSIDVMRWMARRNGYVLGAGAAGTEIYTDDASSDRLRGS